jgi:nitroimidazol reductase NimA-like FMN-containing flavoprotein (pyridoxamine 5'-phosphate oxidase superfamily)
MSPTWSRVEELDEADCARHLASVTWGRLAWNGPDGPRILPVNLTYVDGALYLRTDLYSSIADATGGTAVALEIDELDDRLSSGWSVVVQGRAEQVDDKSELADLFHHVRDPWAPGSRPVLVRITPSQVTGRRFLK